jgi:transcriptional regulator with XRE-family HTH domain
MNRRQRDFTIRLWAARRYAGLTRAQLAEKLGVSSETVRHWECGSTIPREDNAITLLRLLPSVGDVPRSHPNRRVGRESMRITTVYLRPDQHEALRDLAKRDAVTMADLIRCAVDELLAREGEDG